MSEGNVEELKVYLAGDQCVIHVPNGQGEDLRLYLESGGIQAKVSPAAETPFERLEVPRGVDTKRLQSMVDQWRR
jgi:hypothetical protein